jgi:hypothetical protein
VVVSRFAGSFVSSPVVLAVFVGVGSPAIYLVVLCIRLNSICLFKFCNGRIVFLLMKYVLMHVHEKQAGLAYRMIILETNDLMN